MAGYVHIRSVSDKNLHVIHPDTEWNAIPERIRHQGPWQVLSRGQIADLTPSIAADIERQGYAIRRSIRLVSDIEKLGPAAPERRS